MSESPSTPFDAFPPEVRQDVDGLLYLGQLTDAFSFCVPPDQLVTLADGTFKPIQDVVPGDPVLTHDGVGIVTRTFQRAYDGGLNHLYKHGYPFATTLTDGHDVLAQSPERWRPAEDFRPGDRLTTAYNTTVRPMVIDTASLLPDSEVRDGYVYAASVHDHPDYRNTASTYAIRRVTRQGLPEHLVDSEALMVLVGYWLAEGHLEGPRSDGGYGVVGWTFHIDEEDYAVEVAEALRQLGAGEPHVYRQQRRLRVKVTNASLAAVLAHLCGSGSRTRRLAPEVMIAPHHLQRILLRNWHNGDGDATRSTRTASDLLARQMFDLCARLQETPPSLARILNSGGPGNRGKTTTINILTHSQTRRSRHRQAIRPGYAQHALARVEHHPYNGPVYNLEVFPQNSYVVGGTVVHNCGHDFVIGTLRGDEELLAGLVAKDYMESYSQAKAHVWATVAVALIAVDGMEDFCPPATPSKRDYARARFQWVTANWYWPSALYIYNKYSELVKRQEAALAALEDFCSGSQPTPTPSLGSWIDKAPSAPPPHEDIRQYLDMEGSTPSSSDSSPS